MCRKLSPLFHDREQQDGHECLRLMLLYIQEATRAINQQRAVHRHITRSESSNNENDVSATAEASSASTPVCQHAEGGSLKPSSPDSSQALRQSQPNLPDSVSAVAPTAGASMATRQVSTCVTPEHDDLFFSSSAGSSSSQNPTLRESVPTTSADGAKLSSSGTSATSAKKTTPSAGKITNYFASAPPAPKTVSELTVNAAGKVPDFVEALCEGQSERKTRCLECESVTSCTETFQDVEVVAQKAVSRASSANDSDSDCDDVGKKCHFRFCFFNGCFSFLSTGIEEVKAKRLRLLGYQVYTHLFNDPLSAITRVGWYQKGKTTYDFTEVKDSEWQWHQLGICKFCTSSPRSRQITMPVPHHLVFYGSEALSTTQPTSSKPQFRNLRSCPTLAENKYTVPDRLERRIINS